MTLTTAKQKIAYFNIPEPLASFLLAREKHEVIPEKSYCQHPKNTGIPKKDTTFFKECCHVRFDRKTLPKSGKSIVNECFVESKAYGYLVWDKETRALFGIVKDAEQLNDKTKEWKRRFDEL